MTASKRDETQGARPKATTARYEISEIEPSADHDYMWCVERLDQTAAPRFFATGGDAFRYIMGESRARAAEGTGIDIMVITWSPLTRIGRMVAEIWAREGANSITRARGGEGR